MALSMLDCVPGTIVDWRFERREDGKEVLRPICRRGIIVKVDRSAHDAVQAVFVKFKPDAEAEKVAPVEMDRVYHHRHPRARAALKHALGVRELVGAEFEERRAPVRPKLEDSMKLTSAPRSALVAPEGGWKEEDGGEDKG